MGKPSDQLLRVRKVIHVARESHHLVALICLLSFLVSCGSGNDTPGHGAEAGLLRVHPSNSRWLTNDSDKAIYLSGLSGGRTYDPNPWYHNMYYPAPAFGCIQDVTGSPTRVVNDYAQAFANLASAGLNLTRCWIYHQTFWGTDARIAAGTAARVPSAQMPYAQTGSRRDCSSGTCVTVGIYDLDQWNPDFFARLRSHLLSAVNQGITPIVILFAYDEMTVTHSGMSNPWLAANNVNGISCDANGNGNCEEALATTANTNLNARVDAYVRRMIDEVNDLHGIIWEVANEHASSKSEAWQNHIADLIKDYELTGGRQTHPVMMTTWRGDRRMPRCSPIRMLRSSAHAAKARPPMKRILRPAMARKSSSTIRTIRAGAGAAPSSPDGPGKRLPAPFMCCTWTGTRTP